MSTDPARLELDTLHNFLTRCYWAEGISREVVARSLENSLCFGVFHGPRQIGFARVISDYATYAYLGDVFILDAYRGRGLAKFLMQCIMQHPQLQGLRWTLATRDAHGLYAQFGFRRPLIRPERFMEIHAPRHLQKGGRVRQRANIASLRLLRVAILNSVPSPGKPDEQSDIPPTL